MDKPSERRERLAARFPRWPGLTFSGLLDRIAAEFPERPLILTPEQSFTYLEVAEASRRLASGLIALGLAPGTHVAVLMANIPELPIVRLAIARAGAVTVPVNYLLQRDELAYVLSQSDSRMLIAMARFRDRDYREDLLALTQSVPSLARLIVHAGEGPARDMLPLEAIAALATPASDAELVRREASGRADALSDIVYTSGTTGRPQGVILTHDMVLRAAFSSAMTRAFGDGWRVQFALPMYHVFGHVECLVAAMFVGGAIIPHAVFDPDAMLDRADRLAVTDMVCVPTMTHRLIAAARARGHAPATLHSYFNSGGANVPSVWQEIREVLGAREIHTAYGMSETTASIACTHGDDGDDCLLHTNGGPKLAGSAGFDQPDGQLVRYRAVDPQTGMVLPPNRDGELQVKGGTVTPGYYNKPDETALAFTGDGWLRTGDLGRVLDDGYLRLTGRIKETYRCGGEMVMPREIEELLAGWPGITQVLAVGLPDARMGEVGCLCVVPASDTTPPDAEALLAHCARRLARFKVPRHVVILREADIPMTATGRPKRFLLAELARARLGLPK